MATDLQVAISQMAIQNLLFFLGLSLYDSQRTAVQQCRPEENNVRWFHWDGTHRRRSVSRISQAPISWLMAFSSTNNTITRRRWAAAVGGGMYTAGTRNTDPWPASKSSSVPSSFLFSSYNFGQITSFSQGRPFSVGTDGRNGRLFGKRFPLVKTGRPQLPFLSISLFVAGWKRIWRGDKVCDRRRIFFKYAPAGDRLGATAITPAPLIYDGQWQTRRMALFHVGSSAWKWKKQKLLYSNRASK